MELAHVISPCDFNLEAATSPIITKATDLKIVHRPPRDVQRLDAMDTVANPFPAASAPVEVGIETS